MQSKIILDILANARHASNSQIWRAAKRKMPELSATTVHRITKRLYDEGKIGMFVSPCSGSVVLDFNSVRHHHFVCVPCGKLRDIVMPDEMLSFLNEQEDLNLLDSTIIISGRCKNCKKEKNYE